MEKEYNYIHCREAGIEYKRIVRSYGEFFWGKALLFIHKSTRGGDYTISEKHTGDLVLSDLKTPTIRAAKLHLAKNLSEEKNIALDRYVSQRLLLAYRGKSLKNLPYKKQIKDQILKAYEGVIIGESSPYPSPEEKWYPKFEGDLPF